MYPLFPDSHNGALPKGGSEKKLYFIYNESFGS